MLIRIVWRNIWQRKWRKFLAWSILAVSATLMAGLLNAVLGFETTLQQRLQTFGPNIMIVPDTTTGIRHLELRMWRAARKIFWRNNITAVVPVYYTRWQHRTTGHWLPVSVTLLFPVRAMREHRSGSPALYWRPIAAGWQIRGTWPRSYREVLVGTILAAQQAIRAGDRISVRTHDGGDLDLTVTGIVQTGGPEDATLIVDWRAWTPLNDRLPAHRFYVRALTMPEPPIPVRLELLSPAEQEKWICQPYPTSIAFQLQQQLAPRARVFPIQEAVFQETLFWTRVRRLVGVIIGAVILATCIGVGAIVHGIVRVRAYEITLFQTFGAEPAHIYGLFLIEHILLALTAGGFGWVFGTWIVRILPVSGTPPAPSAVLTVGMITLLATLGIVGLVTAFALHRELQTLRPNLLHEVAPLP